MAKIAANIQDRDDAADFASMLSDSMGNTKKFEGRVVTARVINITDDFAILDVGLKSEGRVSLP